MTPTAALADVVLPAPPFLETDDLAKSYGPSSLQIATPVIERVAVWSGVMTP